MNAHPIRRFALLTLAVLTAAAPTTLLGQEEEDRSQDDRTVIEILDGRVLVNGEEVDAEDGRVVIEGKDGEHTIILRSDDDGYAYWVGDPGNAEFFARWNANHPRGLWDKDAFRGFYDHEGNRRSWENLPEDAADTVWKFFNDGTAVLESLGDGYGLDGSRLFDLERQDERLREEMDIARMETEARELAAEIRRSEGAERRTLEQEFDQKLNEIFDRKLALREKRAEKLAEELDEVRAALQERRDERGDIIERRKRQLLGEEDHLKW